jgi:hypothetical protein
MARLSMVPVFLLLQARCVRHPATTRVLIARSAAHIIIPVQLVPAVALALAGVLAAAVVEVAVRQGDA